MIVSSRVSSNCANQSLLDYLSSRFTYLDRNAWSVRITEGRILLNGTPCGNPSELVQTHDAVGYDLPDFVEPPADLNYEIVYEDEQLLAVNKPGNLLVHHSGKSLRNNLIYHLRHVHAPTYPQAHIVNRLDRETSGLVLVAKDKSTLAHLHRQFSQAQIGKRYQAIVLGIPPKETGTIDIAIGRDPESSISYRYTAGVADGKNSITEYRLLTRIGKRFSLVEARPKTGRTHQIRVHFLWLGIPIVGDKLYTLSDDEYRAWQHSPDTFPSKLIHTRQALHCCELNFEHPGTGQRTTVTAELPKDLIELQNRLESA